MTSQSGKNNLSKKPNIELGEVEHAMLSTDRVGDAAVVLKKHENEETEMVGFVTARQGTLDEELAESGGHVQIWSDHFETSRYEDIDTIDQTNIGRHFIG